MSVELVTLREGHVARRLRQVEQVPLSEEVAAALFAEAQRLGVSRAQVARDAIEEHLGFRGEGRREPSRRWTAQDNAGRKWDGAPD